MLNRYWKHLWTEMSETGRKTFPWDLSRGAANGAVGTLQMTFSLLVAIQFFDATVVQKSLIAGAHFTGLLLSMPYASWSPVLARKTVQAALPAFGAALGLAVAAFAPDARIYTWGVVVFGICTGLPAPIMTAIYRDNYRGLVRGQVFGLTVLMTTLIGIGVQFTGAGLLDADMGYYRILFLVLALLSASMGFSILRMPDKKGPDPFTANFLRNFLVLRENPLFAYVVFAWFLFGFANLALQPQRIEYLSQPQYGLELSPGAIVLIVGVTTEVARLCVIQLWAHLFDRFNFIWLRIMLSSFILVHIVLYYHTHSIAMLVVASACLGAAFGGGAIAWTLWVTKFAPPEETSRYMSVHTFFTGLRGSLGPVLGYLIVERFTIQNASTFAAGLVLCSILLLWRIRNQATRVEG